MQDLATIFIGFSTAVLRKAQQYIVDRLIQNKDDFVKVFTQVQADRGSEEDEKTLLLYAIGLFNQYVRSVVVDGDQLILRDSYNVATKLRIVEAASIYEYGTASIPGKMIWSVLAIDTGIEVAAARNALDKLFVSSVRL